MPSHALKITFLITDLDRGGSPLLLAALAPGLVQRGMDVDVVCIAGQGEIATLLEKRGVAVTSLHATSSHDVGVLPRFVRHLKERRPEGVCSILIHANLLATLAKPFVPAGIKWAQSIHTLQERPGWHWVLQGFLSPRADVMVTPSQAVMRKLERWGPLPRAVVIPNGIDVRRFAEAQAVPPDQRPWPVGAFVVGYIGRFDPVKRLPVLLAAVEMLVKRDPARFARLHVALIGYGSQEKELRKQARAMGIAGRRVHLLPPTPEPERWYKALNVFCSPSPAEGFGLTLAEAAVAGIPVIACGTAAVRETLAEALWLTEAPTAAEVARTIEQAMFELRFAAAPRAEMEKRYAEGVMMDRYEGLFRSLCTSK